MKVSAVALGGWTTFGEVITAAADARRLIQSAYDNGIIFFDIADGYSNGESERLMGTAFKEMPRHTLVISSKLYWPMSDHVNDRGLSRKHIMSSIEGSLARIGTDHLDIYYCHRFDQETPVEEVARAMDDLVHQGKVLYWGTSEWSGAQITQAWGVARGANLYAPAVDQPGYSLLGRTRVESDVLPAARACGIGLTTFAPLSGGVLTGKYDNGVPQESRAGRNERVRDRLTPDTVERVKRLLPIAEEAGLTRAQLAIAWALRHPEVSSVITGATGTEQIEATAQAGEAQLTPDVIGKLDELFPAT